MSPQMKAMIAARIESVNADREASSVNDSAGTCVNNQSADVERKPRTDRHRPGYMAAYMREYRLKKKMSKSVLPIS